MARIYASPPVFASLRFAEVTVDALPEVSCEVPRALPKPTASGGILVRSTRPVRASRSAMLLDSSGLSAGDVAEIAAAAFTAVTALAAVASVFRVERDRWRRALPDLHIEILADAVNQEMRMTVANLGGPAREVRVIGTIGAFGWMHHTPPTTYWRPGEMRTYRLSMPLLVDTVACAFVEARDLGKKQLVVATVGGAAYRWPLREALQLSPAKEWERLFPGSPPPTEVTYPQVALELVERIV